MNKFEKAVRYWQQKLQLSDWNIKVVADVKRAHNGEVGKHAPSITLDSLPEYKRATLFYAPDEVEGTEDKDALHEMCHLIVEPLRDVLEDSLNQGTVDLNTLGLREVYGRWAGKANESVACHIARVVMAYRKKKA